MLSRFAVAIAMAAVACTAVAKESGPATFDDTRRALLAEDLPDAASAYSVEMTEFRAEYLKLQASDDIRNERKLKKMEEKIEEMQNAYKEEVKRDTDEMAEELKELTEDLDKLMGRYEKANEAAMPKLNKELDEIKTKTAYLTLKKFSIGRYGGYGISASSDLPESLIGNPAPVFRLGRPDSDPRSLETATRAPILVVVFISSANKGSASYAAALYNTHRSNSDVDVIAIAVGDDEPTYKKARLGGMGRMMVLLDPEGKTAMQYRVTFAPQAVVMDKERVIRQVTVGTHSSTRSAIASAIRTIQDEMK